MSVLDNKETSVPEKGASRVEAPFRFDPASFWARFRHGGATVAGVRLHYVEGGQGRPILLLPGWPQSWFAWRMVMPALADAGRRVVTLDPRGLGDSGRPATGYDMRTIAAEVHGFIEVLGLANEGGIDVAGHDLGTWIAYALACDWPGDVGRLALFDASLPGITPPPTGVPSAEANLKTWHFGFNRLDDLPELLVQGRERAFLTWLFRSKATRPWQIGSDGLDEYVRVLAAPGALRAAGSYYQAAFSPAGLAQARAWAERRLPMPVLAMGAETGVGDALAGTMRAIATSVQGGILEDCGHYMPEERPEAVADALLGFLASHKP